MFLLCDAGEIGLMVACGHGPLAEVLDGACVCPFYAYDSVVTLEPFIAVFVGQNPRLLAADGLTLDAGKKTQLRKHCAGLIHVNVIVTRESFESCGIMSDGVLFHFRPLLFYS